MISLPPSMKSNRHIVKVLAVVFILLFSQKIGAGLFLHSWLHVNDNKENITYSCTCIDDFLTPFDETPETVISQPVSVFNSAYQFYNSDVVSFAQTFAALRGPPVFI